MQRIPLALIGVSLLASGCATPVAPVAVTRFHLGAPVAKGSVEVEPATNGDAASLEFRGYAAAVAAELQRVGYTPVNGTRSEYLATVDIVRTARAAPARRSPVTVGVGGGTGGGGVGLGGGVSFGVGGKRGDVVATELSVRIRRRADATVVWEGRAQTEGRGANPASQPGIAAGRLAQALFEGFPGESGRTISVP